MYPSILNGEFGKLLPSLVLSTQSVSGGYISQICLKASILFHKELYSRSWWTGSSGAFVSKALS